MIDIVDKTHRQIFCYNKDIGHLFVPYLNARIMNERGGYFVKSHKYDLFLYTKGYNIETSRLNEYKKYNVDYYTSYILVIKSNGKGLIKRYEVSLFRKIRDFAFIYTYRIIKKWF